ncbi:hypothetical protein N9K60_01190 [Candidatus Poseidoniales archaeon]|nr:hypothetical protein [Candidatus Poseidoniales archaeon]
MGNALFVELKGEKLPKNSLFMLKVKVKSNIVKCAIFSKFVNDGEDDTVEELNADELPPEIMTDGRGNTTLENW